MHMTVQLRDAVSRTGQKKAAAQRVSGGFLSPMDQL